MNLEGKKKHYQTPCLCTYTLYMEGSLLSGSDKNNQVIGVPNDGGDAGEEL